MSQGKCKEMNYVPRGYKSQAEIWELQHYPPDTLLGPEDFFPDQVIVLCHIQRRNPHLRPEQLAPALAVDFPNNPKTGEQCRRQLEYGPSHFTSQHINKACELKGEHPFWPWDKVADELTQYHPYRMPALVEAQWLERYPPAENGPLEDLYKAHIRNWERICE